jgi:DNA-binding NarL/FixJ family response regulator
MTNRKPRAAQSSETTRVVLVDDHPLVRERLREIVDRQPDLEVCGEAENRAGGLAIVAAEKPDLAVVDLSLKESSGLELIKDLHTRHAQLKILVLSMHDGAIYAERAIRAGANGYITKDEATSKVIDAIRVVLAGECYLPADIARMVLSRTLGEPRDAERHGIDRLSDRELDVFRLIARGWGVRQIAEALHLDAKTIETYRARIKEKLGYRTSAELLQAAISWEFQGNDR